MLVRNDVGTKNWIREKERECGVKKKDGFNFIYETKLGGLQTKYVLIYLLNKFQLYVSQTLNVCDVLVSAYSFRHYK